MGFLIRDFEQLHNIKEYRTPQGTRSFARVFIILMPWFYGPYAVWISRSPSQDMARTDFGFALLFSLALSVAMVGLYNVQRALQDPFDEDGLDDIRVSKIHQQLLRNFQTCTEAAEQLQRTGTIKCPNSPRRQALHDD